MKSFLYFIFSSLLVLATSAGAETKFKLKTLNGNVADAAIASYSNGKFLYLQNGALHEQDQLDVTRPMCLVESYRFDFDKNKTYAVKSLDHEVIDGEVGELVINLETSSKDPSSFFMIYCFIDRAEITIDDAKAGLKTVFEIE